MPGLCFPFINHRHLDNRVKLPELGKEVPQVDGVPGLEDAEDAAQHDLGCHLLPLQQLLLYLISEEVLEFLQCPRRPHANYVIILMPVYG